MMLRINSFQSEEGALLELFRVTKNLSKNVQKISTGWRINRASDDPSGLVISEKIRPQIAGLEKEIEGMEYSMLKLQTADGYLSQVNNQLIEMKRIAIQAANAGLNDPTQISALQKGLNETVESTNQMIPNAQFGSNNLFDGSTGSVANVSSIANFDITTQAGAEKALSQIEERINQISEIRGKLGGEYKYTLETNRNNLMVTLQNLMSADSSIRDVDMAKEYVDFVKNKLNLETGMAMLAQGNLNSKNIISLLK
jgi:flagellin